MNDFEYFAFISYSSKDMAWGKRLQRKLEHYRMPATLCSERGWKRKPMDPVFFAPYEIQPGGLGEELKKRLRASRNLIVICSPNSAKSEWVGKEIEYFFSLGRADNIHFFIVDGIPNSGDPSTECFNPIVNQLGIPEILGANIHEKIFRWPWLNRERAYIQLISKLLGVGFDSIWKRHRRRMIVLAVAWTIGIVAIISAITITWISNQPFDTKLSLKETSAHNSNLPPLQNAVVTIYLDEETKTDTIANEGDIAIFSNIPHKYLGKNVRITFSCQDFYLADTTISLGRSTSLNIQRDPAIYGNIRTEIWDFELNKPVCKTKIFIDQWEVQSDEQGIVKLNVPLAMQKQTYQIAIPDYNKTDTLTMPTSEYSSIGIN